MDHRGRARSAPRREDPPMIAPRREVLDLSDLEPPRMTDLGNARRLVTEHGQDIRYIHEWGEWLIFDGRRWATDKTGEILRRAKQTVQAMYRDASYSESSEDRRELSRHAMKSESARALTAMVTLAQSEPGIPVTV